MSITKRISGAVGKLKGITSINSQNISQSIVYAWPQESTDDHKRTW